MSVPYATDPGDHAAQTGHAAGLQHALVLIERVRRERAEIEEQMRNDPPGTVYGP